MSKNTVRNITIPLKATLNMTKNKSMVSSSFDMLEDNNSPVYGGCIYPIHIQEQINGSLHRKWDKFGNYYTLRSGWLYKNESPLFYCNKTCDITEYSGFYYNNTYYKATGGYFYNGTVYLYHLGDNNVIVQSPDGGFFIHTGAFQSVTVRDNYIYIAKSKGTIMELQVYDIWRNLCAHVETPWRRYEYQNMSAGNVDGGTQAPQIIVSTPMPNTGWIGVTVLNHKQDGTNPYSSCRYVNVLLHNSRAVYYGDVNICCHDNGTNSDPWGIFCDDSLFVYSSAINASTGAAPTYYSSQIGALSMTYMGSLQDVTGSNLIDIGNGIAVLRAPEVVRTPWKEGGQSYAIPIYYEAAGLTTNQRFHRLVTAGPVVNGSYVNSDGTTITVQQGFCEMYDSGLASVGNYEVRKFPGFLADFTVPTTTEGWTGIWQQTYTGADNTGVYNPTGSCTNVGNWRILYNYKQGYISGISYTNGNTNHTGVLVTPWNSVDDACFIAVNGDQLLYRDCNDNKVKVITASTFDNDINRISIVDNRYVVVNTTSEMNSYDCVTDKIGNWASDWNNRCYNGFSEGIQFSVDYQARYKGGWSNVGTAASGQHMAVAVTKDFTPSAQFPFSQLNKVYFGNEIVLGGDSDVGVDVYYRRESLTAPQYQWTYGGTSSNTQLINTTYPVSSGSAVNYNLPIVGVTYVSGYTGKFGVQMGQSTYSIQYDGIRPIPLYNSLSLLENADAFFIVQSQYYAVVNGYIAAISYNSSNAVSSVEQIVDINGMTFIGAFPSVAYFWSPSTHSIFAFTGDADLQLFVQSNRINTVTGHMYAPNNEWIYIATDDGLYVITQMNIFRIPSITSVYDMYATDETWNVVEAYKTISGVQIPVAYKIQIDATSGFTTQPITYRTVYFGPGDHVQGVIDTWYIRLYKGDEPDNGTVTATIHTLTDTTSVSTTDVRTITSDMWDDNDTYFMRIQPQYQLAQGVALALTSDYPIASVGCSMSDEGNTQVATEHAVVQAVRNVW